jgi:hypothetical protein
LGYNWASPAVMTKDLPTLRPADIVAIMEHHFGANIATLSPSS